MKSKINTAFIAAIIADNQLKSITGVKTHLKMAAKQAKKNTERLAVEVNALQPDTKKGFYALAEICGKMFNIIVDKVEKGQLEEYLEQLNQIE